MMILLVEDEPNLSDALSYILKKNNYCVNVAFDGITGQDMAESSIYDLIILDRMLPGKEGLEVLKDIRKKGIKTPVLILTAKNTISDKVEGLDCGADDYLSKPFSKDELLARLRALLRRQADIIKSEDIKLGLMVLNPKKGEIECGGEVIKLTMKESQLLELLLRNKNQVITKEQILDKLWGFSSEVEMNNVEVYLSYLRKKLNTIKCNVVIETMRGMGYCLKEVN
jgi:two-component system response regulator ArlR